MKNDILTALTNFGASDLQRANEVMDEANITDTDVANHINELIGDGTGIRMEDIDVVGQVYEHILQMSRNEIIEKTNIDIENDKPCQDEGIYTASNYMATSYDWQGECEQIKKVINSIEDRSQTLQWFLNSIS